MDSSSVFSTDALIIPCLLHFAPCSIKPIKIDFVYCEYLAVGCANGGLAG